MYYSTLRGLENAKLRVPVYVPVSESTVVVPPVQSQPQPTIEETMRNQLYRRLESGAAVNPVDITVEFARYLYRTYGPRSKAFLRARAILRFLSPDIDPSVKPRLLVTAGLLVPPLSLDPPMVMPAVQEPIAPSGGPTVQQVANAAYIPTALVPHTPESPVANGVVPEVPTFVDVALAETSPWAKYGLLALGGLILFYSLRKQAPPRRRRRRPVRRRR